jgi:hypothetical protein
MGMNLRGIAWIAMALLVGCAETPEILIKIPADHAVRQTDAASMMLHDQLRKLVAGDKYALKHPYYCVVIANRDGKVLLPDGLIDDLKAELPREAGAILAPESECPIVNGMYTLPSGAVANLLMARWEKGSGQREYWKAGIIAPGGLSGGGYHYWVSFTADRPSFERDTRWLVF